MVSLLMTGVLITVMAQNPVADPGATVVSGNARFTVLTPEMIRIEYSDKGVFEDRATFAIQNRLMDVIPQYSTTDDGEYLYITTDKLTLKYRKGSFPKTLPASPDNLSVSMTHNGQPVVWYPGKPDPLNLKGTCRTLDGSNGDNKLAEMEDGVISRSGWAVIDDSWSSARADGSRSYALQPDDAVGFDWWSGRKDPHALDMYFMGYGSDYKKAIGDFTKIAGKIPLPPAYVFGYWYSKYASYSADDYRQIMADLKANGIPADVMILDMDWHWNGDKNSLSEGIGGWTGWSWNTNLISDPEGLLREIHDNNFKIALNLHPADGINSVESPGYYAAMKSELGGKYDSNGTIAWNLDFTDFTKSFFKNIIRDHEREGVDFWWLDWQQYLTSPTTPGLGETFWCNHVFFNDMSINRPDRRPVIFHRWGGLGSHRYQIGFSGDALINFPTLAFQPYFTATASNVGYAYWGHDLGGHAFTDENTVNNPELVLRWIQFGVFTPIFRTHATKDDRIERRMWKFPNFPKMREAVNLRYALFPYLYTMARKTYDTGIGMCRPMYYDYPDAEEAYAYQGQYMFGDDMLVAPVTEAAPKGGRAVKEIWFPQGQWWDVNKKLLVEGPCVMSLDYADDEMPYFFKAGSMIPFNPAGVKNVTARPDRLVLHTVAGSAGSGALYEDQGDNPDYATVYAVTPMTHTVSGDVETYSVLPRTGDAQGIPSRRGWTLNIHNAGPVESVAVDGTACPAANWKYDPDGKVLTVETRVADCARGVTVTVKYLPSGSASVSEALPTPDIKIGYDRAVDSLVADFGARKESVSLSVCNLAGVECLRRRYADVTGFAEPLTSLSDAVYVCRIDSDDNVSIKKIVK